VQLYNNYAPTDPYDGSKLYKYDTELIDIDAFFGVQYARNNFTIAFLIDSRFSNYYSIDPNYYAQTYHDHAISGISTGLNSIYYKSLFLRANFKIGKKHETGLLN
jgi:hypothetical protein